MEESRQCGCHSVCPAVPQLGPWLPAWMPLPRRGAVTPEDPFPLPDGAGPQGARVPGSQVPKGQQEESGLGRFPGEMGRFPLAVAPCCSHSGCAQGLGWMRGRQAQDTGVRLDGPSPVLAVDPTLRAGCWLGSPPAPRPPGAPGAVPANDGLWGQCTEPLSTREPSGCVSHLHPTGVPTPERLWVGARPPAGDDGAGRFVPHVGRAGASPGGGLALTKGFMAQPGWVRHSPATAPCQAQGVPTGRAPHAVAYVAWEVNGPCGGDGGARALWPGGLVPEPYANPSPPTQPSLPWGLTLA